MAGVDLDQFVEQTPTVVLDSFLNTWAACWLTMSNHFNVQRRVYRACGSAMRWRVRRSFHDERVGERVLNPHFLQV